MTQRTSFILAAVLTSFILVVVGGVAARVAVPAAAAASANTAVAAIAAPTLDPTAQALLAARDAQYQQGIQQANQQLQQAYADQQALADQLAQTQGLAVGQAPAPVQLASAGSPASNGQAPAGSINQAQAISAAKAYLGGGNVVGVVMDNTHGATAYKVTFDNGTNVYVNVATGQVAYVELARGGGQSRESSGGEHEEGDH